MEKALRYNIGKLRLDLIPQETVLNFIEAGLANCSLDLALREYQKGKDCYGNFYYIDIIGYHLLSLLEDNKLNISNMFELSEKSLEVIGQVFTMGALKYDPQNWKKGLSWTETFGSLLRHYRKYKLNQVEDEESQLNHLAHALVNAIFLKQFYHIAPWYDDRLKDYLLIPRIALDLDDTVADFLGAYKRHYGLSNDIKQWFFSYKTAENLKSLEKNKDFWVNLPVLHVPDFTPAFYISSREIPIEWSKEFLEKNNLPCKDVYHVGYNESKTQLLKELNCQLFIDDKLENIIDAQKANIASFLMDNVNNRNYEMGYRRIYDLKLRNIIHT